MSDAKLDQVVEELEFIVADLQQTFKDTGTTLVGVKDWRGEDFDLEVPDRTASSISATITRLKALAEVVRFRSSVLESPAEAYGERIARIQEGVYEEGWDTEDFGDSSGHVTFGHRTTE